MTHARPLRLAYYGSPIRGGGSGPGSHYLLLDYLLQQGHGVDLYGIEGLAGPQGLERYPNLRWFPARLPVADAVQGFVNQKVPACLGRLPSYGFNAFRHWCYHRRIERAIWRNHARHPYDALLVFDMLMPFRRNPRLFCVNWPQGTPLGELEGIQSQKSSIVRYGGRLFYLGLVLLYKRRLAVVRWVVRRADRIICASPWTAASWARLGIPDARAVSFALDLEKFHPPAPGTRKARPITFLHLGRIVPRKRLDLALEGFRRLRREYPDLRLLIVGRVSYPRGYEQLLDPRNLPEGVEHHPRIGHQFIPDLLRKVHVLIQPSENEDFGSAVMEAQGSGLPVVLGPTNGTKYYAGAKSSFVFSDYTPDAVAEAMRRAVVAVDTCPDELIADARQAAEKHFAVAAKARSIVEIVREARHRTGERTTSAGPRTDWTGPRAGTGPEARGLGRGATCP